PVVVTPMGIVTARDPLFGTFAAKTTGNVFPPSVEYEIFTLAAFTGALVVFATFHVTVCIEPPAYVTLVFGEVIANGPLLPSTVTTEDAVPMPPPPAWLSRATTWNVIVRAIAGKSSPVRKPPVVDGGTFALLRT